MAQTLIVSFAELREAAVGGHVGNHIIIEPGATQPVSEVVVVPRGAYDVIHAQAIYVPGK